MVNDNLHCKYAVDWKGIGRQCVKDENISCRYWGHSCWLDEEAEKEKVTKMNQERPTGTITRHDILDFGGEIKKVIFYDDDGDLQ